MQSRVQFDKIATIGRTIISGQLGVMPGVFMAAHAALFLGLFGFDRR